MHDGQVHLFFQHVPDRPRWDVACEWGHVVGDDLVRWRHHPVALRPGAGEDGCWSGSAVVDGGVPVLVYTSAQADRMDLGRVALARPVDERLLRWRPDGANPVVHPPRQPDLTHFRDPAVTGGPGRWRMVVGAGLTGRGGAVLGYRGTDLPRWQLDGVLADAGGDPALGQVWECPHLVELGDSTVLLVSVWSAGRLERVVAAVGREVDGRFVGGPFSSVGHGGAAYAMTTFLDPAGRCCAVAWLRHEGEEERTGWEGMLSLPLLLEVSDGAVRVRPHPDVDTLRGAALAPAPDDGSVDAPDGVAEAEATLPEGGSVRLHATPYDVVLSRTPSALVVRAGKKTSDVPVTPDDGAGGTVVRVLVDRGVVEAWTADGQWVALRIPWLQVRRLSVTGAAALRGWALETVYGSPLQDRSPR